jgi:hypothetical protein
VLSGVDKDNGKVQHNNSTNKLTIKKGDMLLIAFFTRQSRKHTLMWVWLLTTTCHSCQRQAQKVNKAFHPCQGDPLQIVFIFVQGLVLAVRITKLSSRT